MLQIKRQEALDIETGESKRGEEFGLLGQALGDAIRAITPAGQLNYLIDQINLGRCGRLDLPHRF